MFHKGARATGGNIPSEDMQKITALLDEFLDLTTKEVQQKRKLRRGFVRSQLSCSLMVVLDKENVAVERSARNIPGIKVLRVEGLNVYDILAHDNLVFVEGAVGRIQEVL